MLDGMRFAQGEVDKSLRSFPIGSDGLIERGFQLESSSGKTMPGGMSGPWFQWVARMVARQK